MNLAEDIIDTAKEIERLDGNRSKYQQSENLLTTEQYRTMQRLEDDIPDTIKNLNDMEMRDSMLKNDMGYLRRNREPVALLLYEAVFQPQKTTEDQGGDRG